jgi:hypothetical protein
MNKKTLTEIGEGLPKNSKPSPLLAKVLLTTFTLPIMPGTRMRSRTDDITVQLLPFGGYSTKVIISDARQIRQGFYEKLDLQPKQQLPLTSCICRCIMKNVKVL